MIDFRFLCTGFIASCPGVFSGVCVSHRQQSSQGENKVGDQNDKFLSFVGDETISSGLESVG